jgi:MoxR-like ATPase
MPHKHDLPFTQKSKTDREKSVRFCESKQEAMDSMSQKVDQEDLLKIDDFSLSFLSDDKLQQIVSFVCNGIAFIEFYEGMPDQIEFLESTKERIDNLLSQPMYQDQVKALWQPLRPFIPNAPEGRELDEFIKLMSLAQFKSQLPNNYLLSTEELKSFRLINTKSKLLEYCSDSFDYALNMYNAGKAFGTILDEIGLLLGDNLSNYTNEAWKILITNIFNPLRGMRKKECLKKLDLILEITQKAQGNTQEAFKIYTSSYTSQPELKRALQGKSDFYVKISERLNQSFNKETIVHLPLDYLNPAFFNGSSYLYCKNGSEHKNVLHSLENHLEFSEMKEQNTREYNFKIDKVDDISTNQLKEKLSEQHKDLRGYHIIDYNDLLDHQDENNPLRFSFGGGEKISLDQKALSKIRQAQYRFQKSFNEEKEVFLFLLESLTSIESLEIEVSSINFTGSFKLPKQCINLSKIKIQGWTYDEINLDQAINLETIQLSSFCLNNTLDLSKLPKVKNIEFDWTCSVKDININPLALSVVNFDFKKAEQSIHVYNLILKLFQKGCRITLWDKISIQDVRSRVAEHLRKKQSKSKGKGIGYRKGTASDNEDELFPDPDFFLEDCDKPSGMQPSYVENKQVYEVRDLLNDKGPIQGSSYRKKMLTHISLTPDELLFNPYVLNVQNSVSVPLLEIKKAKQSEFNEQKAAELNCFETPQEYHPEAPQARHPDPKQRRGEGSKIGVNPGDPSRKKRALDDVSRDALSRDNVSLGDVPGELHSFLGKTFLSTKNSKWVPLPGLSLNDELMLLDEESLSVIDMHKMRLKLRFSMDTSQYFVRLLNLNHTHISGLIQLHYGMTTSKKREAVIPEPVTLPEELNKAIYCLQKKNPELASIFLPQLSTRQRINEIISYCKGFKDKKIDPAEIIRILTEHEITHPAVHTFMADLCFQAGSCHHRSRAFMALAHYFKIPARVNQNDSHEMVEYFLENNWYPLDLGGFHAKVHVRNQWNTAPRLRPNANLRNEEKAVGEFDSLFNKEELLLDESNHFNGWYSELRALKGQAPLLEYDGTNAPFRLHDQLMQQPHHVLGKNYFYIESADDFDRLLMPLHVNEQNECEAIKGPLLHLFESNSPGTLLINWSNFEITEIANYKSILDTHPTLKGCSLSSKIKVINIIRAGTEACSSFNTRTQKIAWPKDRHTVPDQFNKIAIEPSEHSADTIDLYERFDWETLLIGGPRPLGEGFIFAPGLLTNAIQQKSISLTGLPKQDTSFIKFFERIRHEKGFYANGEWESILDDFVFHIAPNPSFDNRPLESYDAATAVQSVIYINKQNYHALFEQYSVESTGLVTQHPGILSDAAPNTLLVITDRLTKGELRRLKNAIACHPIPIQLKVLSHLAAQETSKSNSSLKPLAAMNSSSSAVVLTSDVQAASRWVDETQRPALSVTISSITQFSDLFENVTLVKDKESQELNLGKKAVRFEHSVLELLKSLRLGKTIVLKGDISSELYHQLETLFATPSYLIINGTREEILGKLILITPPKKELPHLFNGVANQYSHEFSWDKVPDYIQSLAFTEDEARKVTERIKAFYTKAEHVKHNGRTTPPELIITEDSVAQIAMEMRFHPHNPIEYGFLQNYTEDKASYEQLKLLAKQHLLDPKNLPPLDCRLVVGSTNNSIITEELKQKEAIEEILQCSPFIELRGTPGTGKTHFIKNHLPQNSSFWGEDKIIDWLESKKECQYLLLDEANMKEPGYWDFLQGLREHRIYYKGTFYPVDPNTHKVIFTGNPENYPNRHHHSFLQQVPKVFFKPHTDEYLTQHIILPKLNQLGISPSAQEEIARIFIYAYKDAKTRLPFELLNIRDVKTLIDRFSFYFDRDCRSKRPIEYAHLVCKEVFLGLLRTPSSRDAYLQGLQKICQCDSAPLSHSTLNNKDYYLPTSRALWWHTINQCLETSNFEEGSRRGILMEGPSGIGKTEMMLRAVQGQGFINYTQYDSKNPMHSKVYVHLTLGSDSISDKILEAFELSKKVHVALVMDELNLLTQKDAELLNTLLERGLPQNNNEEKAETEPNKCKLVFLASQNSQAEMGRKLLSHALLSRFTRIYELPYNKDDLLDICYQSGKFCKNNSRAIQCVDRYLSQQSKYPLDINARTFFTELKKLPELNARTFLTKKLPNLKLKNRSSSFSYATDKRITSFKSGSKRRPESFVDTEVKRSKL